MRFREIVADVSEYTRKRALTGRAVSSVRKNEKRAKNLLFETFEDHCDAALYTPN